MASIRELSSGKFQVQVRHRGMRPVAKSFNTKTEAARFARLLESEIDRGVFVDRSEAQRLHALKKHFGAVSPATLQSAHIAAYRDARLKSGLAGATVVKEINSLSHQTDVAIKDWGIALPANPVKLVRRPPVARGRERRLMSGEEARLFAACYNSRATMLAPVVRLAIETGMRMGEMLALEWRYVDMAKRVATQPDTKTGDARQAPLSSMAIAAISSLFRHIKDGRVFWTQARADSLENAWRRAVKAAGIEDLHFHDLRHEAVSRLFELGLNPLKVATISGHKTLKMLKRYTHLRAAELALKTGQENGLDVGPSRA